MSAPARHSGVQRNVAQRRVRYGPRELLDDWSAPAAGWRRYSHTQRGDWLPDRHTAAMHLFRDCQARLRRAFYS